MSEGNQLFIPPTFLALYMAPGAHKPSASQAQVAAHYELCEDLAQMLTVTATEMQLRSDAGSAEVLHHCLDGLCGADAVMEENQARWVVCRLAELMQWPAPAWQTSEP